MTTTELISVGANLATALGIPVFLVTLWLNYRREKREAEYGTFDALQREYVDFQKLAVEHPRLDVGDSRLAAPPGDLSDIELTTRKNLYLILIAVMERAYLMYHDTSYRARRDEYGGWSDYIDQYVVRPGFVEAFFNGQSPSETASSQFSKPFEADIKARLRVKNLI